MEGCLKGGFDAWLQTGETIDMIIDVEADELIMDIPHDPNLVVLDVRRETEFADGHLADAVNLPLQEMTDLAKISQFEEQHQLYVHCAGGYRSVICRLKKRQGIHNLRNVLGGWSSIKEPGKSENRERSQRIELRAGIHYTFNGGRLSTHHSFHIQACRPISSGGGSINNWKVPGVCSLQNHDRAG